MSAPRIDAQPDFAIAVDGRELEPVIADHVQRVEVVEEVGRLVRARIVLRNWDPGANATDDAVGRAFGVGLPLKISLGYDAELVEIFDGLVAAVVVQCGEGGLPLLEVRGSCRGIRLMGTSRYRVWTDQTDLDAVGALCRDVGLKAVGKAGPVHPFLVQHRVSDWTFILTRAAALGLQPYVRGDELQFEAARTSGKPAVTLQLGRNLSATELAQDVMRTFGDARASAWDPASKTPQSIQESGSSARIPIGSRPKIAGLLKAARLDGARSHILSESVPMEQAELQAWARSDVDRGVTDTYYGTVSCAGDPNLRINSTVELKGLGTGFDGVHYVTRARHQMVPGNFTTELGLGTAPTPSPDGRHRFERVMPSENSLVIGTVESFEDTDLKLGRVKVKFPWMGPDEPPVWARLATPAGGAARGFLFVPEPGDEVLVQFVDGDPRHAIVVGSLWNGKDAPPSSYDPEKNDRRALASRAGHLFVFHDGDETPGVSIETAAGQSIRIDDTSGSESITLEDKTGNRLRLDPDGIALSTATGKTIELTAPGGKIALSAKEISAKADTEISLEGSTAATLKSSASLDVQGANVKVNGSAMLTASAPMIKLN